MNNLQIIILFIISTSLFNCSSIVYENPVPEEAKTLSSFPSEIRGIYVDKDNDTLLIGKFNYRYGEINENPLFHGDLGEDLILKESKGYYFLNYKDSEKYWEMVAAKFNGKQLLLYIIDFENEKELKIIEKHLKSKAKALAHDDKYMISPTENELLELLNDENITDISILKKL